jgi:hypothetical protein
VAAERLAEDAAWTALTREFDLWAEAGRAADLWWRDDDAAAVVPALERLLDLSAQSGVPLALAVIPGLMSADLAGCFASRDAVAVLQHGWRHVNHARGGEGAWELGDHCPLEQVSKDLASGYRRLGDAFGAKFVPVLAPPWNRISASVARGLPDLGFIGLSTFGARESPEPAPGLLQVNAHCDPVKWKQNRRFAGTARALDELIGHLAARRTGEADPDEPTGLVTHHIALDPPAWAFVAELLRRSKAHPAAHWLSAREVFRR